MLNRNVKMAYVRTEEDHKSIYKKLTGFTEFAVSYNAKEYSRKYIDEKNEKTEVVAYQPSISYSFDKDEYNISQIPFIRAADMEYTGFDARTEIIIVDFMTGDLDGMRAFYREYVIIPDTEGDDANVYTYSGTLRAFGEKYEVNVSSDDGWDTLRILED
jgi:hypothetical protein